MLDLFHCVINMFSIQTAEGQYKIFDELIEVKWDMSMFQLNIIKFIAVIDDS